AQYGVTTPRHKPSAIRAAMPLTKKAAPIVQDVVASTTRVEARTHRSTTSEIPAVPVGNIENRRCTLENVAVAVFGRQSVRLVGRLYFRLTARRRVAWHNSRRGEGKGLWVRRSAPRSGLRREMIVPAA